MVFAGDGRDGEPEPSLRVHESLTGLTLACIVHAGAKLTAPLECFAVVVVGISYNHPELRKKRRRQFHYKATVLVDEKGTRLPCSLTDVSEGGARILLESDCDLPERFVLLLTESGEAWRRCRVIWRRGKTVGVAFPDANPCPTEPASPSGSNG